MALEQKYPLTVKRSQCIILTVVYSDECMFCLCVYQSVYTSTPPNSLAHTDKTYNSSELKKPVTRKQFCPQVKKKYKNKKKNINRVK